MRHAARSLERTDSIARLFLANARLKLPQFITANNARDWRESNPRPIA
jgi:hypothetical protein